MAVSKILAFGVSGDDNGRRYGYDDGEGLALLYSGCCKNDINR